MVLSLINSLVGRPPPSHLNTVVCVVVCPSPTNRHIAKQSENRDEKIFLEIKVASNESERNLLFMLDFYNIPPKLTRLVLVLVLFTVDKRMLSLQFHKKNWKRLMDRLMRGKGL
ncbi:hypothetical protein BTO00_03325 [Vibrio campbellii]|nr:hypothetical protein BTO00_03325 [Vibrio campbellii]